MKKIVDTNEPEVYLTGMRAPNDPFTHYHTTPDAWQQGLERIRAMSPWQRVLIDPELVDEALYGETRFLS